MEAVRPSMKKKWTAMEVAAGRKKGGGPVCSWLLIWRQLLKKLQEKAFLLL